MNVVERVSDDTAKTVTGNDLVVRELLRQGVDTGFFLMGGPMTPLETLCIKAGIRMIDVRHEQAAGFMAQAYARRDAAGPASAWPAPGPARSTSRPAVANAFVDGVPVVALGGSSPVAPVRDAGLPGDRPGRRHAADHQMGGARLRGPPHRRIRRSRLRARDVRQARPGLSRPARRHPVPQGPRERRRLQPRSLREREISKAMRRADAVAKVVDADRQGEAADRPLRQRHPVVGRLRRAAERSSRRPAFPSTPPRRAAA